MCIRDSVKDLLSLLRWAENPRGRMAGFRVAQLLPGIGPATAGKLMDAMAQSAEPLRALREFKPGAAAQAEWGEMCIRDRPYFEPSRPRPDCLTPPNGPTSLEIRPVLMPTMPYSCLLYTSRCV